MVDVIRRIDIRATTQGVDQATAELRTLSGAQTQVAQSGQTMATVTDISSRRQISAAQAYDRLQRSIDGTYRASQQLASGTRTLDRAMEQGIITDRQRAQSLELLRQKYVAADVAQDRLGAGMGRIRGLVGMFAGGFGLGLLADPSFLFRGVREGVSSLDDLGDAAAKAAVSAERLQVLRFAVEQNEGSFENADRALIKFNTSLGQFTLTGGGPAANAFKALGISVRDAGGNVRDNESVLDEAVTKLSRVGDEAQAAAIRAMLFGKEAGPALTGALAQGVDGLAQYADQLRDLGIFSDETIAKSDNLDKKMRQLGVTFDFVWKNAAVAVGESVIAMIEAIQNLDEVNRKWKEEGGDFELFGQTMHVPSALEMMQKELAELERQRAEIKAPQEGFAVLQMQELVAREAQLRADIAALQQKPPTYDPLSSVRPPAFDLLPVKAAPADKEADKAAKAIKQQAEALRQRTLAMNDSIAAAQLELGLLGQTIGEAARLTAEFEMLTEARDAAIAAGRNFIPEDEIARIKAYAAALGLVVEQTARVSLAQDTLFKIQQMGRTEFEQGIAETLRSIGLEGDAAAESWVRFGAEMDRAIERADALRDGFSSVFHELRTGGDVAGALMEKLASWGEDMVTTGLFGPPNTVGQGLLGPAVAKVTGMPTTPAGLADIANVAAMHVNATTVMISGFNIPGGGTIPSNILPGAVTSTNLPYAPDAPLSPGDFFGSSVNVATLPAGMRNNNPGNIKFVGQNIPGIVGPSINTDQGDPQAVFSSPQAGMDAMAQLIMRKFTGGKTTADALIAENMGWTPGNYGAAANVAKTMGIGAQSQLNLNDPAQLSEFMKALTLQEHGPSSRLYGSDMYSLSAQRALGVAPPSTAAMTQVAAVPPPAPLTPSLGSYYPTPMYPPIQMGGNASTTLDIVGQMDAELLAPATQSTQAIAGLGTAIGGLMGPLDQVVPGLGGLAQSIVGLIPSGLSGISPQVTSAIASGFGGFWAEGGELGAGKWGIAGERGPEIIHGPAGITPMRGDGPRSGGPVNNFYTTNVGDARARVEARENESGGFDVHTFAEMIKRDIRDTYNLKEQPSRWSR